MTRPNSDAPASGPAVLSPGRRSRIAIVLPVAVVLATLALLTWSSWPVVRPARSVEVAQAVFDRSGTQPDAASTNSTRSQRTQPTVQAAGWLEAEPFIVACTALADGIVESIDVLEGDRVEKGQAVARLIAEDSEIRLRRAEAELASARAERSEAEAELRAARLEWDEPVELERAVESGRASLAEQVAELERLPLLIESAEATLRGLTEELTRVEQSSAGGASNELELIVARQHEAAQRASVAALQARGPVLAAGADRLRAELRAAERDLSLRIRDRLRVDSAEAGLALAGARVERAAAARDEAALELSRMVIRAPITGYVQRRMKSPGDKAIRMMDAPHSAHILHLYDPEQIRVRVDVPLADVSHVSVGQRCEVTVDVLPDSAFEGEVLRITHEADLQKNTLEVHVKVIDPSPVLRPEMLTRVKFLPGQASSNGTEAGSDTGGTRVLVPEGAIEERGDLARVWLVTERQNGRGVLRAAEVVPESRESGWVTVSGTVRPGALLAMPQDGLRDGERVIFHNDSAGGAS